MFHMVVHRHKLGEVERVHTLHDSIVLAIFLLRIIKFGGNLSTLCQKKFGLFFIGTRCTYRGDEKSGSL